VAGGFSEVGPIWRSVRRHRAFALLVTEVALGFVIIGNLAMTIRWYGSKTLPPSGHREDDVVEVTSRRTLTTSARDVDRLEELRARELATLAALPGVLGAARASSTQLDDQWATPGLFWAEPGVAVGPSQCAGVARAGEGAVIGWPVSVGPTLADVVDLRFVAGNATATAPGTVVITRCLAEAVFGQTPAVGQLLFSSRHPPARVVGVVEDVRMHVALVYQSWVTALYPAPEDDPRFSRTLVRTVPGRAEAVRAEIVRALGALEPVVPGRDQLVGARLFRREETETAGIAHGTVVILSVVGGMLGLLAILGNFAVAAFLVSDRRRVIGVRRALGATRWDIFRYLLIENLLPTQLGNLLGLLVMLAMVPAAKARFAGITFEPLDALGTALLLSLGGILAKLFPALSATHIPPSDVTRAL
jgi:putative ABC transport system permease protein